MLGVLPVALTRSEQPPTPPVARLNLSRLYRLSPMGTVGCFLSGLITAPFWVLGPVYAQRMGHDLVETTLFMSLVIAGGTAMQFPLGWLSDRVDRRTVLIGVFCLGHAGQQRDGDDLGAGVAALAGLGRCVWEV